MTSPTVSFHTFGCRLNQSETALMRQSFSKDNYKIVNIADPSDIAIINTCTVTENGDADTRRLINQLIRKSPKTKIALVGCQSQIQKGQLAELPNVRWIVGNAKKLDVKSIIEEISNPHTAFIHTPAIPKEDFTISEAAIDPTHTRANLKIQDGCDFFCSFCEIPYARGRARSRVFENIILEANALSAAGHKEIVLTGINIGTYRQNNKTLLDVVEALEQIEAIERIRISSIEPTTIPKMLIKKMGGRSKLCRHLHIPLQSGEDTMLKSMKRKYTVAEFNTFIAWAREEIPEICIGTDVIVGFPGETENSFDTTYKALKEAPIDYFHVFSYSARHLAKSQNLAGQIPQATIAERSKRLRTLSSRKRQLFYNTLLHTEQHVLFEQKKDGYWRGITDHYAKVHIRSIKNIKNKMLKVYIHTLEGHKLKAVLQTGEA